MKRTNFFLAAIGVALTLLSCARPGGSERVVSGLRQPMKDPDYTLKVTHTHPQNGHDVTWKIKDKDDKGAFLLVATKSQILQWQNADKDEQMSIIVNDSNNWQTVQPAGTFKPPTYGPGCLTCGQVDIPSGTAIQLTASAGIKTKVNHYQIVVADQEKTRATTYDYDMVDATIVWSDVLKDKDKGP